MVTWLKQSTAVTIIMGPFVDDADGKTAETGLSLAQADIRLSKNAGTFAQKSASAGTAHMENGYYSVDLSTTDTNTVGNLVVAISKSGALPVWRVFMVVPSNTYNSLVLTGGELLQVDARQWIGTALATPDTAGYPKTTIKDGTGTGEIDTSSGGVVLTSAAITAILGTVVEGTHTLGDILRILLSANAGKGSGLATSTVTYRNVADSKARITATVDADGNRTAVTLDGT